jgi:hypothetical protein
MLEIKDTTDTQKYAYYPDLNFEIHNGCLYFTISYVIVELVLSKVTFWTELLTEELLNKATF